MKDAIFPDLAKRLVLNRLPRKKENINITMVIIDTGISSFRYSNKCSPTAFFLTAK